MALLLLGSAVFLTDRTFLRDRVAQSEVVQDQDQAHLLRQFREENDKLLREVEELRASLAQSGTGRTEPVVEVDVDVAAAYFPPETLLGDPSRAQLVSHHSLRAVDSYPMCMHPVWGKACAQFRETTAEGQVEYRAQQQRERDSGARHVMCPANKHDPVLVQMSGFCFWEELYDTFSNTSGCPVPCQAVVFQNTALPSSHVFLEQCYVHGRPKNTKSVYGVIGLEYWPDNALTVDYMKSRDITLNWSRRFADVYVNYMYTWIKACGQPRDYHSSPCRIPAPTKPELQAKQLAVMFISKCSEERTLHALELQRWIRELSNGTRQLVSLGGCSPTPGEKSGRGVDKVQALKRFKFHLAYENSMRVDYFTEKQIQSALANTVAVTWAAPHVEDFAPGGAGSFLNALEYATPRELAERMLWLDAHDDEYLQLFAWRSKATLSPTFVSQARYDLLATGAESFVCRTCQHYLSRYCGA